MSRKQSMPISTPIILALLGALVLGLFLFSPAGFNTTTSTIDSVETGFTWTSVDSPTVFSNSADLTRLNWLISGTLGGSESLIFEDGGTKSTKPFTLKAYDAKETFTYDIRQGTNTNTDAIYTYGVSDRTINAQCTVPAGSEIVRTYVFQRWGFPDGRFCVYRQLTGWEGDVTAPDIGFSADIEISNGETVLQRKTISDEQTSISWSDSNGQLANIKFIGSFNTGTAPVSPPQVAVIGASDLSRWRFMTQNQMNDYRSTISSMYQGLDAGYREGTGSLIGWSDFHARAQQQVASANTKKTTTVDRATSAPPEFSLLSPSSKQSASLEFVNDNNILVPAVQIWLRADWVGIYRPVGQPRILSASSPEFGKDSQGIMNVQVRNVGDGLGDFAISLESCTAFSIDGTSPRFSLQAGDTTTQTVRIQSGVTNADKQESCTVKVYDRNDPSISDTERVSLSFSATRVCTANAYLPDYDANKLRQCDADGLGSMVVLDCTTQPGDLERTGSGSLGGYECTTDETPVVPPKNPGEGTFSPVLLIITLILSTGTGVYAWNATRRVNKWLGIITGITAFVVVFLFVPFFVNSIIQMFTLSIPGFSVIP